MNLSPPLQEVALTTEPSLQPPLTKKIPQGYPKFKLTMKSDSRDSGGGKASSQVVYLHDRKVTDPTLTTPSPHPAPLFTDVASILTWALSCEPWPHLYLSLPVCNMCLACVRAIWARLIGLGHVPLNLVCKSPPSLTSGPKPHSVFSSSGLS